MRFFLLFLIMASLTACGFEPMYGTHAGGGQETLQGLPANLGQIDIAVIPNREGQILRNDLIDRFYKTGYPTNPAYRLVVSPLVEKLTELDITKSSEATRAQLRLKSHMVLTDPQGKVLFTRDLQTVTSYNVLNSEFATRVTEDNARQNAIHELARQIELNLSLYFHGPSPAP